MAADIAFTLLGIVVLLIAGDFLVRGAVGIATALKIPALFVSLTVVAFGTSAPELFISVQAVLSGNSGIAIGNIIGSNIANILLVLGLPALVYPISAHVAGLRRHGVAMALATILFAVIAYRRGTIDTQTGGVLFAGIVVYILYIGWRTAHGRAHDPVIDDISEYAESTAGKAGLFALGGLIGLPLGAHLLVAHAASLAAAIGVREEVVGLTIIAFGTSLPELATVTAAAFHKKSDVAMGGVVGSNIFNICAVGGVAGLVGTAEFTPPSLRLDLPVMLGAALIVTLFIFMRRDIGRVSGLFLCLAYAGFIAALALNVGV